ncbi:MAG: hypothetical protein GY814_20510 [Gammaproteobacteria bacterium]|nr:hypothetical protein [Gammaproteobacteria bacterium]
MNTFDTGRSLFHHYANHKAREVVSRFATKNGMSSASFNMTLLGLSFIGNDATGSRLRQASNGFFDLVGVNNRDRQGWFFDGVDVVLGYQGLPTATSLEYIFKYQGSNIVAHSLGALDATNLAGLGLTGSVEANALPFLNIAPGGVSVRLSTGDTINGFGAGWLLNPGAEMLSGDLGGHSSCAVYNRICR